MAVLQLRVGQVWKSRQGSEARVISAEYGDNTSSFIIRQDEHDWIHDPDGKWVGDQRKYDLVELVADVLDAEPKAEKKSKSKKLVKVYKKNSDHFPWSGWTTDMVEPPPQGGGKEKGEGDSDEDDENDEEREGKFQPGEPYETDGGAEEVIREKNGLTIKYDSFDQMINDADDVHKSRSTWSGRVSRDAGKRDWTVADSFEESLHQARHGWPEGMVSMNQIAEEYHRRSRWTADRALEWDVAGSHPDVPVFLSGDPCNMINDGDVRAKVKPIIHIIVNKTQHFGIGKQKIFNFGAALMVCMDQIEACGTRVELEAIFCAIGDKGDFFTTHTTLKRAGEHVEKNRIAYAMANPGFLRRLWFSVVEQYQKYDEWFYGYGKPSEMNERNIPPGAVYIPSLQNFESLSTWDNLDKSVKALQKHLGVNSEY